ncbi:tetratricopeptide repeat protein [Striga asiatica]|uniref:Tetratricopeptide repeat protein n=1 Tax=Striga asiatica TaxID=4170 RepID=A0A5A7Q4D9_STRAF|nr:tetratricopeptide repeat protein [Striga asiatica]
MSDGRRGANGRKIAKFRDGGTPVHNHHPSPPTSPCAAHVVVRSRHLSPVAVLTPPAVVAFRQPPVVRHKILCRRARDALEDDEDVATDEHLLQRRAAAGVVVAGELGHPGDEVVVEIEVVDDGGVVTATDECPPVAAG